MNVFELERFAIDPDDWEMALKRAPFPENIMKELQYIIRWSKGEEEHMPHPMAIGWHTECGWFCLGCGQGPFVIWAEDDTKIDKV